MLAIYNTLKHCKEPFVPIQAGQVRMYVCGVTVYDYCHLGHARVMVVFDMVVRYLRAQGYAVNYVRNITDIDDKIINRASETGESIAALTSRYITAMNEDLDALGVLRPDAEPRATEYMEPIIRMIGKLVDKGYAYVGNNRDVYFNVGKFADYGKLSGRKLDELRVGERVKVQEAKHDPLDFVLWKAAKPNEPAWDSPWGLGRPGWHIECSAMSTELLGGHFDIHGGGQDLQFPHHENEIAQSVCATDEHFAKVWMHNGFVRVDDEKMSKSLDNYFTIRDILAEHRAEIVRFFILSSHYRSPLNYFPHQFEEANAALSRLYTTLRPYRESAASEEIDEDYCNRFYAAMDDDFNSPEAIAVLHELAHVANKLKDSESDRALRYIATLKKLGGILGLLQAAPVAFLQGTGTESAMAISAAEISKLIAEREAARLAGDYNGADAIRNKLKGLGIVLEDMPTGTVWRRA